MSNTQKSNMLLNVITVVAFSSALVISYNALAADIGVGVGVGGSAGGNRGAVGVGANGGVNGGLDRGTGAAGAGIGINGNGVGNNVDAQGGLIASPPETRGNINADGSVSIDRDRAGERAGNVRRKALDTTNSTRGSVRDKTRDATRDATDAARDTSLPRPSINGEATGAAGVGVGK